MSNVRGDDVLGCMATLGSPVIKFGAGGLPDGRQS